MNSNNIVIVKCTFGLTTTHIIIISIIKVVKLPSMLIVMVMVTARMMFFILNFEVYDTCR